MDQATSYRAVKCRLYPDARQEAYFRKMFRCCRVVFNHFLEVRTEAYEAWRADGVSSVPSRFEMCRMLTAFKKTELDADGRPYLKDVDSTALVYEVKNLDDAFRRFFWRIKTSYGNAAFPKFKGPGDRDSATVAFKRADFVERRRVRFAKIGWVKASVWREIEGQLVACTVSVDEAGRWWAALLCKDVPQKELPPSDGVAVVRLGAGGGAAGGGAAAGAAADGAAAEGPAAGDAPDSPEAIAERRQARRRRREERKLARRQAGDGKGKGASKRYLKEQRKVAREKAREADRRQTQASQAAAALVKGNGTIVLEGEPEGAFEGELAQRIERKCAEAGRRLIRKE